MGSFSDELPILQEHEVGPKETAQSSWTCPHYAARTRLLSTYSPKSPTGFVGLKNQGGTCYLNSLLQTLFMAQEFRSHLLSWEFHPDTRTERNIPYQLQALMARMQSSACAALDTKALTASFGWDHSDSFVQHDVQELNRVLFQALEQYVEKTGIPSFLTDLYEQEMLDYIQCNSCKTRRQRTDKYQDVALMVKGCRTLQDSLDNFVQPETLEGIDCETCGSKQDAQKGLEFRGFPKILTLQLRRFDFDLQTFQRVKVYDAIQIPFILDVSPWLPNADASAANTQYQLLSILLHRGTALGGHYFAFIRDFTTDKWYSFNDESVEEVPLDEVSRCLHHRDTPDASAEPEPATPPTEGIIGPLFEGQEHKPSSRSGRATPYMLVYRSCELGVTNSANCPTPAIFADAIVAENREVEHQRLEYEKVKDLVEIKVYHNKVLSWVICNQNLTVEEFTTQAYHEVLNEEEKQRFPLPQVRIRAYNTCFEVMGRSYTKDVSRTLKEVGLQALSSVALEMRGADESWEEYVCDDLSLRLDIWQDDIKDWKGSTMQIRGDATCEDLVCRLAALCLLDKDDLAVSYKETPNKGRRITPELYPQRLLDDLNIGQTDRIFVEDIRTCPRDEQGQLLPHGIRTIESVNFWTFHFNPLDREDASESIVFDSRRTFRELKEAIARRLELPVDEFRLKRDKRSSFEVGNPMSAIIRHTVVQSGSVLFVERGKPLSDNDLNISIYRYTMINGVEKLELLFKRVVSRDTTLMDFKHDLADATGIPVERLRLREVSGNSVRHALTLRTLRDHYAEGRGNAPHLAAQEVAAPETLTPNDLILRITPFKPDAERFGVEEQTEIIVDRNSTVRQLKRKIGEMYNIEELTIAKVLNATLEKNPKNVLFDNIGSLSSVEQYQDSIITKHPLNLKDNDNLLFKEGQEFTKPSTADQRPKKTKMMPDFSKPSHSPTEKALVIHTEFSPVILDAAPLQSLSLHHLEPDHAETSGCDDGIQGEFDDTAAELGDDDRSDMNATPPMDFTDPGDYPEPMDLPEEQYDATLQVLPWDFGTCMGIDPACSICLTEYDDGEHVGITPCQHSFHPECFHRWFVQNYSCPACLHPFPVA